MGLDLFVVERDLECVLPRCEPGYIPMLIAARFQHEPAEQLARRNEAHPRLFQHPTRPPPTQERVQHLIGDLSIMERSQLTPPTDIPVYTVNQIMVKETAEAAPVSHTAYEAHGATYIIGEDLFRNQDRSAVVLASQVVPCPEYGDGVWREQQQVVIKESNLVEMRRQRSLEDPMGELTALWHTSQPGHRNVVRLLNFFQSAGGEYLFIVLPYLRRGDLLDYLNSRYLRLGLPEAEGRQVLRQAVYGLLYLKEKGLAHGDLSPENLALDEHGNVVLIDPGMCRPLPPRGICPPTRFRGKREYAPIETFKEWRASPLAADVFSLGATLFTLLRCQPFWVCGEPTVMGPQDVAHRVCSYTYRAGGQVGLSSHAKDLLCAMLHPDFTQRPTLEQILSHPWLQQEEEQGVALGSPTQSPQSGA